MVEINIVKMNNHQTYIEEWIRERTGLGAALTAERLRVWQRARLREAEEYAAEHSRFYQERFRKLHALPSEVRAEAEKAGIHRPQEFPMPEGAHRPQGFPTPEGARRLQGFTTPEDIRRDPEAFLCVPPKEIARVITLRTSGSQGKPKRLFFTEEDLLSTADFFEPGMAYMTEPGQRVTVFMDGPGLFTVGGLLKIALERRNIETEVHGFVRDLDAAEKAAGGAHCLVGAPGQMALLAEAAPGLRPRTVLLSGDYVPASVVKRLQDIWGCEVFTHWGMTETGYGGGVECDCHQGYHMRDADLWVEIIDPETGIEVPAGTYGEVVISTFSRRGMPLLHYRTGDIGRMLAGSCACGGVLPRLDKVMGRLENTILLPGGNAISIHRLDEVLFACENVGDYAAELAGGQQLNLTIAGNADLDEILSSLQSEWPALEIVLQKGSVERSRKRTLHVIR